METRDLLSLNKITLLELVGILPNQIENINIHKRFLTNLKRMKNISKYVIPHEIKKRAIYTEILADNANPKVYLNCLKLLSVQNMKMHVST